MSELTVGSLVTPEIKRLLDPLIVAKNLEYKIGYGIYQLNFKDHLHNSLSSNLYDTWERALLSCTTSYFQDFDRETTLNLIHQTMSYYSGLVNKRRGFDNMRSNGLFSVFMKENYQSLSDIDYVNFILEFDFDARQTNYHINIYFNPIEATYTFIPSANPRTEWPYVPHEVKINVYYKDIRAIIKPLLTFHLDQISSILGYRVDVVTDEIVKLLEMIKIS